MLNTVSCIQFRNGDILYLQSALGGFRPTPLSDAGLASGDNVAISAENKTLISLATGFVQRISETRVALLTDRYLFRCYENKI